MKLKFLRWPQDGKPGIAKKTRRIWVGVAALSLSLVPLSAAQANEVSSAPARTVTSQSQADSFVPAHEMKELNFLLGELKCSTSVGHYTLYLTTKKILGGNYYEMKIQTSITLGNVIGYWTFGWNSIDQNFITEYYDNTGATGTATSAGWQNGQITFLGNYTYVDTPGGASGVAAGGHIEDTDGFQVTGPKTVMDYRTYIINGVTSTAGYYSCTRI